MSMTAEIISVGTELLLGNILNTNAQYLSRELAALGITVQRESTIGDNHSRLADFVNEAKQRCDLLVFTGGLGPTADDLTKETVASCYGDTLAFDAEEWDKIVAYFTRTGRTVTPNNRKQAMVPVHGRKVVNRHGTAPGAWFEQDGRCAVLMPGVPHEMKAMWQEEVRPLLLARQNCALHSLTLRVLGGESNLEYQVRDLLENANPTAAIYCKTGECEIRITARAKTDTEAETMCRAYAKKFYDLLGDAVYDEDVAGLEETVVHTLQHKGLTLATAESCTGGHDRPAHHQRVRCKRGVRLRLCYLLGAGQGKAGGGGPCRDRAVQRGICSGGGTDGAGRGAGCRGRHRHQCHRRGRADRRRCCAAGGHRVSGCCPR